MIRLVVALPPHAARPRTSTEAPSARGPATAASLVYRNRAGYLIEPAFQRYRPGRMEAKPLAAGIVQRRARPLRVLWYVATAIAAGASLFVEPALAAAGSRGAVPPVWMFVPIGIFCLLFGGDAVDRWRRVRLGRYPAGPALLQTLFGLVFASVLLSSTISDYRAQRPQGIDRLLDHPDSEVRADAIYALGFRDPNADRARRVLI